MKKRPTLKDPEEFALMRELYFDDNRPLNDNLDPIEKLERMESKHRNLNKSSR